MNTRTISSPSPRRTRGLAAVEAVIVLPVLLLLMLAIAEVGRAYYQYVTLATATREAARYLATDALVAGVVSIDATLASRTRRVAVYGNANGTGTPRLPGFATGDVTVSNLGGNDVGVATAYRYQPIVGSELPTFGLGAPISLGFTLRANVSMRAL
jgi:Flp pilus assembly protein TadG